MKIAEQMDVLLRGCEAAYTPEELEQRLIDAEKESRPLRVKLGLDPTAPDIHLGHTVVLHKMRQFQDLGHKAVLIIGDYTARIGDPSGANVTRPVLDPAQIEVNASTYFEQAGRVLDTAPAKLEIRYNSEWLEKLTFADILRLAGQMTVARMMERDTFELRFKDGVPIGVHEFLYPLVQAYDSVCIAADVELGGSDQTFNNLCGRTIQQAYGQKPQIVLIMPILVGLDGVEKMSKSKGNYVGITDEPADMFGKVMSIPDELMANYYTLLTDLPADRIKELTDPQRTHPRQAKAELARMITAAHHGKQAAAEASAEFDRVFRDRKDPTNVQIIHVRSANMKIVDVVHHPNFPTVSSATMARNLIRQGAVSIDGKKITDVNEQVTVENGQMVRIGKRRFGRIQVDDT